MIKKSIHIIIILIIVLSHSAFIYADTGTELSVYSEPSTRIIDTERIDYNDGSYAIITTESNASLTRATYQIDGKKTYNYYQGDICEWSFTITGTYTYDGQTALASNPKSYTTIYVSGWSTASTNASSSGATVNGSATMNKGITKKTVTLSLTCSANGTLK